MESSERTAVAPAVKVFAFVVRKPGADPAGFHAYWREQHGAKARRVSAYRRYVQSHRVELGGVPRLGSPHDGSAELWFDDVAAAAAVGEDPYYRDVVVPDEATFIGFGRQTFRLIVDEQTVAAGPAAGLKLVQCVRRAGGSPERFQERFARDGERQLGAALGAVRHLVNRSLPESYAEYVPFDGRHFAWLTDDPYDAVRELWWEDAASLRRAAATPAWDQLFDDDEIDPTRSGAFLAEEFVVTDRPLATTTAQEAR